MIWQFRFTIGPAEPRAFGIIRLNCVAVPATASFTINVAGSKLLLCSALAIALFSGADGMTAIRRLVREAGDTLAPGGLFALEVDARRASLVAELVSREQRFHAIRVELDLTGRERFVLARRQETDGDDRG